MISEEQKSYTQRHLLSRDYLLNEKIVNEMHILPHLSLQFLHWIFLLFKNQGLGECFQLIHVGKPPRLPHSPTLTLVLCGGGDLIGISLRLSYYSFVLMLFLHEDITLLPRFCNHPGRKRSLRKLNMRTLLVHLKESEFQWCGTFSEKGLIFQINLRNCST